MESVLWVSEGFNHSTTTTANSGILSPYDLWGPPADAGLAVLQTGLLSRSPAEENGPAGTPVFFPGLWIQPRKEATASRSWTSRRKWLCTRAASHSTSRGNSLSPRLGHSDRECPTHHMVPKRRFTFTSSSYLSLLPHPPSRLHPLRLSPHQRLHQLRRSSPHQPPRRR